MGSSAASNATYVSCLTPAGTAAIATLALHGGRAWEIIEALFQPAGKQSSAAFVADLRANRAKDSFWFGRFGKGGIAASDEVVLAIKSIEPVPSFEIHCHGGREVVALLQEWMVELGAEVCTWQEFTARTQSRTKAEALDVLTRAPTLRTAGILLDQYHGALAHALQGVLELLKRSRSQEAREQLQQLARWSRFGVHLTTPWKVAIAGAPNVGKSSLVNRLAGYRRSIVAETPGTTRDLVTTLIALEGWPVELMDTAGVRELGDPLERQGMALAQRAILEADLCLWLLDGSALAVRPDFGIPQMMYVISKTDLPPAWDFTEFHDAVHISAATGAGIDELCNRIISLLVPEVPLAGTAVPFTASLAKTIQQALDLCTSGNYEAAIAHLQGIEK